MEKGARETLALSTMWRTEGANWALPLPRTPSFYNWKINFCCLKISTFSYLLQMPNQSQIHKFSMRKWKMSLIFFLDGIIWLKSPPQCPESLTNRDVHFKGWTSRSMVLSLPHIWVPYSCLYHTVKSPHQKRSLLDAGCHLYFVIPEN